MLKRTLSMLLSGFVACAFAASADQSAAGQKSGVEVAPKVAPRAAPDTPMLKLTLTELAKYNGRNNMPAYVAISDTVYDVSNVKAWAKGKHHGNKAGTDCTKAIQKSPHKLMVLKNLKKVGIIVAESKPAIAGAVAGAPDAAKPAPPAAPVK